MSNNISLNKLTLKNFKGIKDLEIDFSKVTNIYGDNATGKTTIFDAFTWLLFDKDSKDRTSFDIKTLDSNGEVIHGLEHEVTGELSIDGKDVTLSKIYKEKWTKRRGEAEKQLTGHETLYYIDEVPVKKSEYQEAINDIINENIFKLITNPLYFSNMKWQDRRKVLIDIIGDISTDKIINYRSNLMPLEGLLRDKDIDTLKKSISARKKKLNDDIKGISPRIDELNNSIVNADFEALEFQKRGIIGGIKNIEEKLLDKSKVNDEHMQNKDKLYKLQSKIRDMENEAERLASEGLFNLKAELGVINHKIQTFELNKKSLLSSKENTQKLIDSIDQKINDLRQKWYEINQKELVFDENAFICPTCKRAYETDDIEAMKQRMFENFNQDKAKQLNDINHEGKILKEQCDKYKASLKDTEEELARIDNEIKTLNGQAADLQENIKNYIAEDTLSTNPEYQELKQQAQILEESLKQPVKSISDTMDLKAKKTELEAELEEINKKLAAKDQNGKFKQRINELMEEEKKLAQQIADLEKQEYLTEEFIKTKVELLESSINSKFNYVTFKLFDTQVNGGITECCEALINGVPYSNANTASQINAGLDIINALSEYYNVQAPIFIDNRESVNQLIETNSQVINLIVSKDKNLRVEEI